MRDFNWCHGPECHQKHTVDRVRGVKGSKVLRTRKIKINKWNEDTYWRYFCSQGCESAFMREHIDEFIRLHPRTECLETPIQDPTKERPYEHAQWYQWEIKVDETRQID